MSRSSTAILGLLFISVVAADVGTAAEVIEGIGHVGDVQRLHTGFGFLEGPAVDADGNLYFSDIPGNRIHRRDAAGSLTIFQEPSGHCNGLTVVGNRLLACEMDGRLKEFSLPEGRESILSAGFEGVRFNAPNDLVADRTGGIYFTDPRFRAPDPWPQGKEAVYYRRPDGQVKRLMDNRVAPNGVILSPDEKTLYIVPSMERQMWAYPVDQPGEPGEGRVFCELQQGPGQTNGGGDGLTVDTRGNLYITSSLGLQVFDPSGKLLGILRIPEQPANVTFGGRDRRTLLIAARTSLYAVETEATGHVFPGGPTSP